MPRRSRIRPLQNLSMTFQLYPRPLLSWISIDDWLSNADIQLPGMPLKGHDKFPDFLQSLHFILPLYPRSVRRFRTFLLGSHRLPLVNFGWRSYFISEPSLNDDISNDILAIAVGKALSIFIILYAEDAVSVTVFCLQKLPFSYLIGATGKSLYWHPPIRKHFVPLAA